MPDHAPAERPRRGRFLRRAALATGAILAAAALGAWAWIERSAPRVSGRVELAGLEAPVSAIRDAEGIPHVFAASAWDAYAAQGYLHAQDRFAQMDAMRMVAKGRLAELIGRTGLANDRFMRGLDLVARAENAHALMPEDSRMALEAYARGINAYLTASDAALPLELRLSGRTPEPWHPVDSLLWGEVMAIHLSGNWRDELARLRLSALGHEPDLLRLLWPDWAPDAATSIAREIGDWAPARLASAIDALPPQPLPPHASNGWVFSGARTRSGKPLLANDPHLQLGAPGVWYLIRLEAPGFRRVGASAPGVPGVVLGHNGSVAWGMTTTGADVFDLVVERLEPGEAGRYATPSGPTSFALARHSIAVKGESAPETIEIRRSRHGPVLADLLGPRPGQEAAPEGHVLVLRSALDLGPNTTAAALLRMTAARDVASILEAAREWRAPVQNLFAADRGGRIALAAIGAVPIRRGGDGSLPVPGWDDRHAWTGAIPSEALPRAVDPPGGFLMNANNRLVGDRTGVFLTGDWDAPYRGLRLQAGLADATDQDIASAAAWQADAVSSFAQEFLAATAGWEPRDPEARAAIGALRAWPGDMRRDRFEPLVFNAWMRALRRDALRHLLGDEAQAQLAAAREAPALMLAIASDTFWLCARYECRAAMERTLTEALAALRTRFGNRMDIWRWGDAHRANFENPLWKSAPLLGRWFGFDIRTDGDNYTVNRATPRGTTLDAFPVVHGAGLRAVYDLADLDASRFMIAPGQSGYPLSRHWRDLAAPWADGALLRLDGERSALARSGRVLEFVPAGAR